MIKRSGTEIMWLIEIGIQSKCAVALLNGLLPVKLRVAVDRRQRLMRFRQIWIQFKSSVSRLFSTFVPNLDLLLRCKTNAHLSTRFGKAYMSQGVVCIQAQCIVKSFYSRKRVVLRVMRQF